MRELGAWPLGPLVVLFTLTSCGGGGPDGEEPMDGPEAEPSEEPEVQAMADPIDSLPPSAVEVVREASTVEAGPLRIVAVEEAEGETFQGEGRVAGYPVQGELRPLGPESAEELASLVLDPGGYATPVGRCRNSTMLGARFSRGDQAVELALGVECRQAVWAFPTEYEVGRWGGTLGEEVSARVATLLAPAASR